MQLQCCTLCDCHLLAEQCAHDFSLDEEDVAAGVDVDVGVDVAVVAVGGVAVVPLEFVMKSSRPSVCTCQRHMSQCISFPIT